MSGIFFPFHFNSHHICICICTFYNHICISRFCACLFKLFDACSPPVDPHRRVVPNLSCLIIITARKCIQTSCKHANLFFSFWSIYQLVTTTNNIFPSFNLLGGCQCQWYTQIWKVFKVELRGGGCLWGVYILLLWSCLNQCRNCKTKEKLCKKIWCFRVGVWPRSFLPVSPIFTNISCSLRRRVQPQRRKVISQRIEQRRTGSISKYLNLIKP